MASRVRNLAVTMVEKVLNVAEKNDAAKTLASILSQGRSNRREGFSQYNKIYEFPYTLNGRQCHMTMTSVSGHVLNYAFNGGLHRNWKGCNPVDLFDAPVSKMCIENMENIKRTLEAEVKKASTLIIWTDCDREGENIGFEIIEICKTVNRNMKIYRAKFSEITPQSVQRAIHNLDQPDQNQNNAVNVRSQLDLRIGAAFTRFQTMRLQKVFPQVLGESLISYGSCQFPTLGFVAERYNVIENFIPERFWKVKVTHEDQNCRAEFSWKRDRLFNELVCKILYEKCQENPLATVTNVRTKDKSKWRPLPLDTVELEKIGSRKLRMNAKETMRIAEKLYTGGYISYPRTETNIFPKELNLVPLIEMQTASNQWGDFANRVLDNGPNPRHGKKSDQAHPPIHPTKFAHNLQGNEQRIYEFIVRHFLACLSKDAKGVETIVDIDINAEEFAANGLMILERNYLDVYPYDKWSDKEMPIYQVGQTFDPTLIDMNPGETSPPNLLTEADLISLMEKHGIGTDATHAEHIEKIKERMYVGLQGDKFVPGQLGMGLVNGYDNMGFEMSKPYLRAGLESDLKLICDGRKNSDIVLQSQIQNYKEVFENAVQQAHKLDGALAPLLNQEAQRVQDNLFTPPVETVKMVTCPGCESKIVLQNKSGKYLLTCQAYPTCKESLWFPSTVAEAKVSGEICLSCPGYPKKIEFKYTPRAYAPLLPNEYTGCVGCDEHMLQTMNIQAFPKKRANRQRNLPVFLENGNERNNVSSSFNNQINNNSRSNNGARPNLNGNVRPPVTNAPSSSRLFLTSVPASGISSDQYISPASNIHEREESEICQCNCGKPALRLTVRKESANKGRQFYKCGAEMNEASCNFFLWADEFDNKQQNSRLNNSHNSNVNIQSQRNFNAGPVDDDENAVCCNCGIPAKRLTVQKEGPNKARLFYACSKLRAEQCGFFQWDDAEQNRAPPSRQTANKKKVAGTTTGTRKCGLCGQTGHNRKNCPTK